MRKERCTYITISSFFALSYIGRFLLNQHGFCGSGNWTPFAYEMTKVIVYLVEGASMGVLMIFHMKNFKQSRSILSQQKQPYASLMPGEYYRFDTDEVDGESLEDRGSREIDDSDQDESEQDYIESENQSNPSPPRLNSSDISIGSELKSHDQN